MYPTQIENRPWKEELLQSISSVSDLLQANLISSQEATHLESVGNQFKVRITPYYASLMSNSRDCPIRKQAIPELNELDPALPTWAKQWSQEIYHRPTPWTIDAIGDIQNLAVPRLTHRYGNRAILHLSSLCGVYCRFCFRKSHLNDAERTLYEGSLDPAIDYLSKTPSIRELILTGGDPLSTSDQALKKLLDRIHLIPSIKTVRIHSRMAVTLPSRFSSDLLELFEIPRNFNLVLVSHFNHPKELSPLARNALREIRRTGVQLFNQSVLLKGINASADCLGSLFQELYETGVVPFYLHHPDWTPGTVHFRTSLEEGKAIYSQLKGKISGPALPHYILDIPQGYGKVTIHDGSVRKLMDLPEHRDTRVSSDCRIRGAVYQVTAPTTRAQVPTEHRYLDLFIDS